MTKVLLCQGYNSNSWTFPRGKVNENEDALTCACRETFEETGFDPTAHCAGEENAIIWIEEKKLCKLFIGTNIPEHTKFEPQTRKEIGNVAFHSFDSIVKSSKGTHVKTWGVVPFLSNLKRWIHNNRTAHTPISAVKPKEKAKTGKMKTENVAGNVGMANNRQITVPILLTRASQAPSKSVTELSTASAFSLADPSTLGWSAKDMFKTNEKLTGKKLDDYDGNAHTFGATHPRYVNYAERDKSLKQSGVGNKSAELGTLPEEKVSSYADLLKQLHLHVPIYHSIGSDPDGKLIKLFPETNAFQFDLAAIKIALRPSAVV